jgi:hypothetical protein
MDALVMAGLVPRLFTSFLPRVCQDVDARHKAGHDGDGSFSSTFKIDAESGSSPAYPATSFC